MHPARDPVISGANGSTFEQLLEAAPDAIVGVDDKGNIYVSELLRNELWVLSPDGSKRALVANKKMAPLDSNTSLAWYKGAICTANLGFTHQKPEEADKTIVCIRGYDMP